ncbi:HNH endonuclease [Thalassolituus sp. C2-1]|uniref:HNH endonuclease n=1 Tax=Venatorbacter sp. C2-1 TaxID=2597518 RepID=UPI00118F212D|nr:hypothetical protein [Thalassolituus sp. C2-1]TVV44875.1 hypothetical protein FOT50_06880 [Thalassolituus sp. C2-1]
MPKQKNLYRNDRWFEFSQRVKLRDNNKCLICHRSPPDVVLQVHHELYIPNKQPWEYALSDCSTLCKGCHAREHGLIEPNSGWFLISIDDLGDLVGTCERENCGNDIRYEHLTYHPQWGYKKLGSTCIEHLTKKDKNLSGKVLACYRNISSFVHSSHWYKGKTKSDKPYIGAKHSHDLIRIYGNEGNYAFQIAIKEKGRKFHHFKDIVRTPRKALDEVKELSYIALKGLTSDDEEEKEMLRNLYRSIK